jgi:glycosyltransferase involved in cell wall biosynthesis
MKNNTLYISYDGLLDPLGQSQILPYLERISHISKHFFILSFEKSSKLKMTAELKMRLKTNTNIVWVPLVFSNKFGLAGKFFDLIKMLFVASYLVISKQINIIHARGHPSAITAYMIKKILFIKKLSFIFDFRGLWVDERVEKGGWNLSKRFDLIQFNAFKHLEKKMLQSAESVVVLTERLRSCLSEIANSKLKKIYVVPCCADFKHFLPVETIEKDKLLLSLKIPSNAFIVGYVGSIGSMYDMNSYFKLLDYAQKRNEDIYGLIITNDSNKAQKLFEESGINVLKSRIRIMSVNRKEIPKYFGLMSVSTIFLNDSYARLGTSPTKFAESLALGVPVIVSRNIGDLDEHISYLNAGISIDLNDDNYQKKCLDEFKKFKQIDPQIIRSSSQKLYSLDTGVKTYITLYQDLY